MKTTTLLSGILLSTSSLSSIADTQPSSEEIATLDTVTVSADFRDLDLQQIPSAITVIGEDEIQNRNASHLENILSLAPNVNYAAGSSRGRYFQIRGIGERSQFIDSVNPSVGLIIDNIDMTGLGGAATLFDVEQVEILRGPQGTAFGANALAGAINIKSKQPTKETEGYVEAKAGNYNTQGLGGSISGSLTNNLQARFAISQFETDGYMNNLHLNKDDTNNINETVARAQLAWQINSNNDITLSILKTDINNGYDAFSLDNNRNTYSNNPGNDTQDTTALSTSWKSKINSFFNLEVNTSISKTESEYSFDEDWSYGTYDENTGTCLDDCLPDSSWGYSSEDEYLRDYERQSLDIRALSGTEGQIFNDTTSWVAGINSWVKNEELDRNHTNTSKNLNSTLKSTSTSIYTELTSQVNSNTVITYGLRAEDWSIDYDNSKNISKKLSELLWGGKITVDSFISQINSAYITLARGFKSGGVNSDPDITDENRIFETEINNTIEMGLKSSLFNDDLQSRIAVFFTQREDQQIKQSFLFDDDGEPGFKDYYANAGEGHNYGIEIESVYTISKNTKWDASIGLLKTEFIDYSFSSTDDDDNVITISKKGREQAQAPLYSLSTAITQNLTNSISLRIETELKDSYYYSDSHDEKSSAYQLWNASLNYKVKNLELSLHGKNLTDEEYTVRGFGFGNNPQDWNRYTQHTQLGDPRLITLQARYSF